MAPDVPEEFQYMYLEMVDLKTEDWELELWVDEVLSASPEHRELIARNAGWNLQEFSGEVVVTPTSAPETVYDTTFLGRDYRVKVTGSKYVISLTGNSDTFISGTIIAPGELYVDMIHVAPFLQRQGLGRELTGLLLQEAGQAGEIVGISGELETVNRATFEDLVGQGYSPQSAARSTPAARINNALGFTEHVYDPGTNTLRSTRRP